MRTKSETGMFVKSAPCSHTTSSGSSPRWSWPHTSKSLYRLSP